MNLTAFEYTDARQVRTIQINGETWFVVSDICDILNLGTITRVVERLDEDELSQTQVMDKIGRKQQMHICNESGLYNLILRSDKPEAKSFKKWVTKEVLPAIRKTGSYSLQGKTQLEALLITVQQMVAQEQKIREHDLKLVEHEDRISKIEAKIKTTNKDYFSLAGYYALRKRAWNLSNKEAQSTGKLLTKASQSAGMAVIKVQDSKYGEVNGYHQDILAEVLKF